MKNTLINAAAYTVLAGAVLVTCWAIRRCWRRADHGIDSMVGVVRPCLACAPDPHGAPECICVLFCGATDCTGSEDKLFAAWEAEVQRGKLRRVK